MNAHEFDPSVSIHWCNLPGESIPDFLHFELSAKHRLQGAHTETYNTSQVDRIPPVEVSPVGDVLHPDALPASVEGFVLSTAKKTRWSA